MAGGRGPLRDQPAQPQVAALQPWFEFLLVRRLGADRFVPAPGCDAALVSIRRRTPPLLPEREAAAFGRFTRRRPVGDVWELVDHYRRRA